MQQTVKKQIRCIVHQYRELKEEKIQPKKIMRRRKKQHQLLKATKQWRMQYKNIIGISI